MEPVEALSPRSAAAASDDPVLLAWKHLTVHDSRGRRVLLQDVTGDVHGQFLAIMGPSGSGKTTLMNTLARRLQHISVESGQTTINGAEYNSALLKRLSGYVIQDDLLFPHITVEETLRYSAALRMPQDSSNEERHERVEDAIRRLGLESCRNTIVGNATIRGISGGERKRLCVAIELLTRPRILFLDEPTSGLDSASAYALCAILKELSASRACTVVCTIHQPQNKIFQLFDSLLVMARGRILYQGSPSEVLRYYERAGFPLPPLTNPADHLLDVISNGENEERLFLAARLEGQAAANGAPLAPHADALPDIPHDSESSVSGVSIPLQRIHRIDEGGARASDVAFPGAARKFHARRWLLQYVTLFQRSAKEQTRQWRTMLVQLVQNLVMALLIGAVFFQIGTTQSSVVRRQPVLFFCVINQGVFGALMLINSFPAERQIVLRERAAGTYYISAYFLAKISVDFLAQALYPVLFSCIVYWMVGLQASAGKFFLFVMFITLCSLSATSAALMVATICRTTSLAVNVLPFLLEVARLFGGYFLSPANLQPWFLWLDVIGYVKMSYIGVSLNELSGLQLSCTSTQLVNGTCPVTSGEQIIQQLGLTSYSIPMCAGVLLAYIVVFRFIAFLALKLIKF
jgi:ATP-binding cassette subfamily G (WHITE) protein 2